MNRLTILVMVTWILLRLWIGIAFSESGWRSASPCKLDDWLCKSMTQLCQALPDPCTATNIDQPWHPENPEKYMNPVVKPSPIHAEQHPEDRVPHP